MKNKKQRSEEKKIIKEGFFIKNYRLSWNYIKESRKFIYLSIILLVLFFVVAIIFPAPPAIDKQIKEIIKQLTEKFLGKSLMQTIYMIFVNNILISFVGLFFGILFAIVPLIASVSNGYILGYVSKIVVGETSIFEMWRLIPHGIFELPAVFISLGLGIRLGTTLFDKNVKNFDKEIMRRLKNSFKVFIFVVLPLLIVAAVIEGVLMKMSV